MYSAVSIRDAVLRFLNHDPLGDQFPGITDDKMFGDLLVEIADRLNERLERLGWNTTGVTSYNPESLAATSIGCLRSLGPAVQWGRSDAAVHQQAFFTLLVALTALLEEAERLRATADERPVRVRRFLSSREEISDPHAPLVAGEGIWVY